MTRPRGFINYKPRDKSLALIQSVRAILGEYVEQLPLTLRQIFYILVTRYVLDKNEKAYKNQL